MHRHPKRVANKHILITPTSAPRRRRRPSAPPLPAQTGANFLRHAKKSAKLRPRNTGETRVYSEGFREELLFFCHKSPVSFCALHTSCRWGLGGLFWNAPSNPHALEVGRPPISTSEEGFFDCWWAVFGNHASGKRTRKGHSVY